MDANALTGLVATAPIAAGQLVVQASFSDPSKGGRPGPPTFATQLPEGMVAVSFKATADKAVSDQITPGDHVNLLVQVPNAYYYYGGGPGWGYAYSQPGALSINNYGMTNNLIARAGNTEAALRTQTWKNIDAATKSYVLVATQLPGFTLHFASGATAAQKDSAYAFLSGHGTAPASGTVTATYPVPCVAPNPVPRTTTVSPGQNRSRWKDAKWGCSERPGAGDWGALGGAPSVRKRLTVLLSLPEAGVTTCTG